MPQTNNQPTESQKIVNLDAGEGDSPDKPEVIPQRSPQIEPRRTAPEVPPGIEQPEISPPQPDIEIKPLAI